MDFCCVLFGWRISVNPLHGVDGAIRVHWRAGLRLYYIYEWRHIMRPRYDGCRDVRWKIERKTKSMSVHKMFRCSWAATAHNVTCQSTQSHFRSVIFYILHQRTSREERMPVARLMLAFNFYFWWLNYSRTWTKPSFATTNVFYIDQWNLGKTETNSSVILR